MNQQKVVETIDLTKTYGDFVAVDKLSLCIDEGEVFGFLGPNGAGKTTTILMLLGLTEPTSGTARICDYNPAREPLKVKRIVGYLPEKIGFYKDLTARQNLEYTARLNGLSSAQAQGKVDEILDTVELLEVADKNVGKFSRGMQQRLGIADVMIKEPKIAFFDEPTTGIDPQGIDEVLNLIADMAKRNITVVLSSHQLPQVQRICTRVGILSNGCLVAEGSVEELGRKAIAEGRFRIEVQVSSVTQELMSSIRGISGVLAVESSDEALLISCNEDLRPQVAKVIVDSDSLLMQMKLEEYGLEEIYRKYFLKD